MYLLVDVFEMKLLMVVVRFSCALSDNANCRGLFLLPRNPN